MAKNSIVKVNRALARKNVTGNDLIEKELTALERKIGRTYAGGEAEMRKIIDRYWNGSWETDKNGKKYYVKGFYDRDLEMLRLVEKQEITKSYYKQWRLNQLGRGQMLEDMRNALAERVIRYNEVAYAYINDATPNLYTLSWNYHARVIEHASHISTRVMNEQALKRLIMEDPNLMPYYPEEKALKRGIDLEYSKKVITNTITSATLTGKSLKEIADILQAKIIGMSRTSAIRAARTASRCASNAGQLGQMIASQEMGIDVQKQWLSRIDLRTRTSHKMMFGEIVNIEDSFSNGLMHPADENGDPAEVYNCRCTMLDVVDGETVLDTFGEMTRQELELWARNRRIWKGELLDE